MPIRPRELVSILTTKFQFRPSEHHSQDHQWYELELEGLPVIATKVSHSNKEIGDRLLGMISKQLRVHRPFYNEMVSCTKSREEYYHQVRDDPFPPWDKGF